MPCHVATHQPHNWVTEGILVVERCEKICGFCGEEYQSGWFTRRHVATVHCGKGRAYPDLEVSPGWTGKPDGNARPQTKKSRHHHKIEKRVQAANETKPTQQTMTLADISYSLTAPMAYQLASNNTIATVVKVENNSMPDLTTYELNATGIFDFSNCDLTGMTSTAMACSSSSAAGRSTPEPFESIDPVTLLDGNNHYSKTTSPWKVMQTARTNGERIEGVRPVYPIDDGCDMLRSGFNELLSKVKGLSLMSDEHILGTAQSYLKAFAAGDYISPLTPTAPSFPVVDPKIVDAEVMDFGI